jgi:hypothetical protein
LKATEQPIDTSTAGKRFLNMVGVFAEFAATRVASAQFRSSMTCRFVG